MAVMLSNLGTGHTCTPQKDSSYSFLLEAESTQDHSAAGRIRSIGKSSDHIVNRIHDLSACSLVPQPTTLPRGCVPLYKPDRSSCYLLHAGLRLGLFFNLEDRGDVFLRNIGWHSTDYTALCLRRQNSSLYFCFSVLQNVEVELFRTTAPKNLKSYKHPVVTWKYLSIYSWCCLISKESATHKQVLI
jgi:hypothetical protein